MKRILLLLIAITVVSGCATTPSKPEPVASSATKESAQPAIPDKPVDVWLMPLEGFPPEYARELEKKFSAELCLNVRATVHAGRTPKMFGPSKQMLGERVRDELKVPLQRLYDVTPKTIFVVLTRDDLNSEDGGTRFLFAMHFPPERLSVVSMARLSDSFFGKKDTPEVTKLRLYKMVKKAIGTQYYAYPRSTDLKSVMYSPVMSLDDLDAVGTDF
ncbi:peptidase [Opitutus sp. ER46]|uniref:peptidase n=1 Tax=Opitutus sp. ER46 TaxID=2161864 RepID=UPI0011B1F520|nr:peptidase [Opitutus sp. ER46]